MSSFEEKFIRHDPGPGERLKRDVQLLADSLAFLLAWFVLGGRIRRAVRRDERENSKIKLEDYLGD